MTFNNFFLNKKVLITGNTGFKGSWLSIYLHYLGAQLYGISRRDCPNNTMYKVCAIDKFMKQYYADITEKESVKRVVSEIKPDIVFHMAAQPITLLGYEDPINTFNVNGMGTAHILDCFRNYDKRCIIVVVTSDKCYRNNEWVWGYRETDTLAGHDPYSASKSVAEIITHSFFHSYFKDSENVKVVSCRAGNVIGGGDWSKYRIIPDCMKAWNNKKTLTLRSPDSTRPWNYVLDVVSGYLKTAMLIDQKCLNGESFNFGPQSESMVSVKELVSTLWDNWKDKSFLPYIIDEDSSSYKEHTYLKLNIDKAISVLGWYPATNISDTLRLSTEWYLAYFNGEIDMADYTLSMIKSYHQTIEKA